MYKSCLCAISFTRLLVVIGRVLVKYVGGLGFEFCTFVAGWRHALRSEWPFVIIIFISEVRCHFIYLIDTRGAGHAMATSGQWRATWSWSKDDNNT